MLLTRRVAAFLLGVGVFQWIVWPTFLHNILDRRIPAGHSVNVGSLVRG